ncbi:MAG: phosphoribosylformylglycinamidine synthase subunit PurS [Actinobacteria bacterium]|nr:phosphoribosylformylglycinamidine synthase subunit PurS [Actinomycetota bacterium]
MQLRGLPEGSFVLRAVAKIDVMLKPGISDVQGQVVERSMPALGWQNVSEVRVGKHLELVVEGASIDALEQQVEQMCERFLANTVIESYTVDIVEA